MTAKTLEQEAAVYAFSVCGDEVTPENGAKYVAAKNAFIAAANARDKEIEELRNLSWQKVAERDSEIEELRARVARLEGMVPKWVRDGHSANDLFNAGWTHHLQNTEGSVKVVLMVPPIPLPEGEG